MQEHTGSLVATPTCEQAGQSSHLATCCTDQTAARYKAGCSVTLTNAVIAMQTGCPCLFNLAWDHCAFLYGGGGILQAGARTVPVRHATQTDRTCVIDLCRPARSTPAAGCAACSSTSAERPIRDRDVVRARKRGLLKRRDGLWHARSLHVNLPQLPVALHILLRPARRHTLPML